MNSLPDFLPAQKLSEARSLFPHISQGKIYLNHAATAPLSTRVVDATIRYLQERSSGTLENFTNDMEMVSECRQLIQKLIHAESADRIALVGNTSDALNVIASGLPWKPGERILLNNAEFPANVHPYWHLKKHGIELDFLRAENGKVTPDDIAAAITPRTRLVALSAVQFLSGYRANLATIGDLCRQRGILFIVDGIQALGAVQIDVQRMNIDGFAAGCQKWQLGNQGTAFLYITQQLQNLVQQQHVGWLSVADPWNFYNFAQPLAATAQRYEIGTLNIPGFWGTTAALRMLLEFGLDNIEGHVLAITRMLMDSLLHIEGIEIVTPANDDERAGIVTVKLPDAVDPQMIFKELFRRNIQISVREGLLRFSPHFYNSAEDISTAVGALSECFSEQLAR